MGVKKNRNPASSRAGVVYLPYDGPHKNAWGLFFYIFVSRFLAILLLFLLT